MNTEVVTRLMTCFKTAWQ